MKHVFREGEGYIVNQDAGGISLEILQGPAEVINHPFKVRTFSENNTLYMALLPGTCNNFVPKISGTYLDDDTPPKISVNSAGKKIVALKVTYSTATFFPEEVEIVVLTSDAQLAASNTIGYLQIASFNVANNNGAMSAGTINQYIFSSQVAMRFKPGSGTASWFFNSR